MSAINIILIVLFVGLVVFVALVARGFQAILQEIRDKLDEKINKADSQLQGQDVLKFEDKLVRSILQDVKQHVEHVTPLSPDTYAAIVRILKTK